ncbi:MAG: exonuclease domain-containing protein [bacterium]|jgi:DNA polymerase III epsilon subunit-like protein|nr:exonuclease domain-containing protein [bacterium]MBK7770546.1 exonuclease domain-containing protein [bacterium]MBK9472549.1 exonuclease domain-containing protein [bacterium]MBK9776782.1 exonuclease domain-containing protein [bacterium]
MRYSSDIVVIDLEASCPAEDQGNNAVERSSIIEIGAVRLDRRSLEITATFSELVRPEDHPIVPFITDITGITPEMVAGCDTFAAVGRRFLDWYGPRNKAIIAAFGAYYDIPLLRKECDRYGLDFRTHIVGGAFDLRAIAIAWLAERELKTSGQNLSSVLEQMDLGDRFAAHRAVEDARAAAAVLQMHHLGRVPA